MGISFDASNAFSGSALMPVTGLITGQMTASGTGSADTKYLVSSADEVAELGGFGSQIHRMAIRWFANNNITTTYIIMQADGAGTAATQPITMSGTATKVGSMKLYIAGTRIETAVAVGDTFDQIAAQMVIDINADTDLPVTAAYVTPTLTLTVKNKGLSCGDLDVRFNWAAGEAFPAGVTPTVGAKVAGTVDPDAQDVLDAIGETWFNVIAHQFTDATNIALIQDYATAQNGPMVQKEGVWYSFLRDTRANMITYGADTATHNNQFVVVGPAYQRLESTYELAAGYAAAVAKSIMDDVAVPLHRMSLAGFRTLDENDLWTAVERNQLATNAITTLTDANGVQTESTVTMYLKNSAGASDPAYQFQNTIFILMELRYTFNQWILGKYPRAKLADNADVIEEGQQVMTPTVGKAEAIAWFKVKEREGKVENLALFTEQLVVRRDTTNVNRLEWLLPPDLMNQFIVGSGDMQFQLQASEG
jgi:phage tail sheath gpL-like